MRYILASASPRRQELLGRVLPQFIVQPAELSEVLPKAVGVLDSAEYLAVKKALAVSKLQPDAVVIGCDTVVVYDNMLLGKPQDAEDARSMLMLLSGKRHFVITGCCICKEGRSVSFSEYTEVEFYPLTEQEIQEYLATGEPYDKAGAYGIQGQGALLVRRLSGDYYNVMGLPIAKLKRELAAFTDRG